MQLLDILARIAAKKPSFQNTILGGKLMTLRCIASRIFLVDTILLSGNLNLKCLQCRSTSTLVTIKKLTPWLENYFSTQGSTRGDGGKRLSINDLGGGWNRKKKQKCWCMPLLWDYKILNLFNILVSAGGESSQKHYMKRVWLDKAGFCLPFPIE